MIRTLVAVQVVVLLGLAPRLALCQQGPEYVYDEFGAITHINRSEKTIYLVFTGHDFYDGGEVVVTTLGKHNIKATFFFTGDFYRNTECEDLLHTLAKEGHYLGAHSDKHLLYCSWEKRDSTLVDHKTFKRDLKNNYREMRRFGIRKKTALFYMPPYEWYNKEIAQWTKKSGLKLINFSPGTYSNADWTYPGLTSSYYSSDEIYNRIMAWEQKHTLNGFLLLIHIGADPRRTDKFYLKLDKLITELKEKKYSFSRLF